MKICLLSDTHSFLDEKILKYAKGCDEIWHAGDIGDEQITQQLASIAFLRAVYGNIDGHVLRSQFPKEQLFIVEGLKVLMTHIGGYPGKYVPEVKQRIIEVQPQVLICGHSHILKVMRDTKFNNMLFFNPGAAGISGFHKFRTLLKFEVHQSEIKNLQAIELGLRGDIKWVS